MSLLQVTPADVRLLARAQLQYTLDELNIARLMNVFQGLYLSDDPLQRVAEVTAFLELHPYISEKVRKVSEEVQKMGSEKKSDEKPTWHWLTLEDAFTDRPPRVWAVEGLLPVPSLQVFFGPPGVFKTFLLQDLVMSVVLGQAFLPPLPGMEQSVTGRRCEQAPALWVDVDSGEDRLSRRFKSLATGRGVSDPRAAALGYASFPEPPFVAKDNDSIDYLTDTALMVKARAIVLDNLGTVSGGVDENSSEMIRVMSGLRLLSERSGAAVVVLHHPNRAKGDIRGHGSILAAVDLAVQLRREDGDEVSCFAVKTRDLPVKPFGAKFTFEHDPDGELRTARFFGTGAPSGTLPAIEEAQLCIKLELHGSVNQSRIVEMVKDAAGIGRNTTLKAIRAMVEAGELIESESANQKFYALAEDGSGDG